MSAFQGWAKLELMGHRVRWGEVQEVELGGAKLLRIDCPVYDRAGAEIDGLTEFYGGAAIYCLTPATQAVCRDHARWAGNPHPVAPLTHRLPRPAGDEVEEADFEPTFEFEEP